MWRSPDGLIDRFQAHAIGYAQSILMDRASAEDAAQEAFVECFLSIRTLRHPAAFAGWLRRIVFKHCDRIKRRRREESEIELERLRARPVDEPLASMARRDDAHRLRVALVSLPLPMRSTVSLLASGVPPTEIATFLDVPLTTVRKRIHDARKRLNERMTFMTDDIDAPTVGIRLKERVLKIVTPHLTEAPRVYDLFEAENRPGTSQWRDGRLSASHADWRVSKVLVAPDGSGGFETNASMHAFRLPVRVAGGILNVVGFNGEVVHPSLEDDAETVLGELLSAALSTADDERYDLAIGFDDDDRYRRAGFVPGWRALDWTIPVDVWTSHADLDDELERFEPHHRDDRAVCFNRTYADATGSVVRPTYRLDKHPGLFMGFGWGDPAHDGGYVSVDADRHAVLPIEAARALDGERFAEVRAALEDAGFTMDGQPVFERAGADRWHVLTESGRYVLDIETDGVLATYWVGDSLWVDEVAGGAEASLRALLTLARRWKVARIFVDRLHLRSPLGRLLVTRSCRIDTATKRGVARRYWLRCLGLTRTLEKLASEFTARLRASPWTDWRGRIGIELIERNAVERATLVVGDTVDVEAGAASVDISGGQTLCLLLLGTDEASEIVAAHDVTVSARIQPMLTTLFPALHPQMENQAL